jgi:SAM-dependent methyltransferase
MSDCTPPVAQDCAARPGEPCDFASIGEFPDTSGKVGRVEVQRCRSCGHGVTLPPLPDVAFLYADRKSQDFQPDAKGLSALIKNVAFAMQVRKLLRQLGEVPAAVLDFGCGSGQFTRVLAEQLPAARVVGSDFHAAPPDLLGDAAYWAMTDLGPKAGTFDLVIAMHVLEHSENPPELLSRIAGMARPGGLVVIEVPHVDCIWNTWLGRKWDAWYVPYHRAHFTRASLRKCFDAVGLSVMAAHDVTVPVMGRSAANVFGCRNNLFWLLVGMALHPLQWLGEKVSGQPSAIRMIARA